MIAALESSAHAPDTQPKEPPKPSKQVAKQPPEAYKNWREDGPDDLQHDLKDASKQFSQQVLHNVSPG
jgi:hypothetical protein